LFGFSLAAPWARAQSGSSAAAQALFDQGKQLMAAGKASEACPKFEESQKLDPGSGTLINLALCYEQTGRTASAWSAYKDAASAAAVAGNKERERGARERASALAPKVPKLTIDVPTDARVAGLSVMRDGVAVGPAQWGVPIPTDPGKHELSAKAPGYEEWHSTLSLKDGGVGSATVPKLTEAPNAASAAPVAGEPAAEPEPAPQPEPSQSSSGGGLGGQRIAALVVGGVGVAGVAVGSIFGIQAMSKKKTADETCDGTACQTDAGVEAGESAHKAGTISTIGMIVGGVGLAAGVTLWLTAPKRGASTQVGFWPGGVTLRRTF
jgi:hypothetical protein